ncbi:MAG: RluA family pseudouridine synthase [Cyanobacteriota bacterium]|nr:RluA family pseudouridine synthase [Cyanobacteriota bacterium]
MEAWPQETAGELGAISIAMSSAQVEADPSGWLPAALNGGHTYRDRVATAAASAAAFYAARHPHSSLAVWRDRLGAGEIWRNGQPLSADSPLRPGDQLWWRRPPWREEAVPGRWRVVLDDGDLRVIDKPSGLPVLPAGGWLDHTLLRLMERQHRQDPRGVPRPVHRLGRFTSGLLVCARQSATRRWLSARLRESTAALEALAVRGAGAPSASLPGRWPDGPAPLAASNCCRKVYEALLVPGGLPAALRPGEQLTIETPIGRRPHGRLGLIWCAALEEHPGDLPARSTLTLLERLAEGDRVEVAIASGRPHQIRIHCAAIGAPLRGDPLYLSGGGARAEALPGDGGYQLRARRLAIMRPDGTWLRLDAGRAGLADAPPRIMAG